MAVEDKANANPQMMAASADRPEEIYRSSDSERAKAGLQSAGAEHGPA